MPASEKPTLLRLFRGTALYGASDVVFALVRFSLVAVYTRILAPADFGTYAVILATLQLVCIVTPISLPSAMMVSFKENDARNMAALRNTSMLVLMQVCGASGAVFFAGSRILFPGSVASSLAAWLILWAASDVLGMVPKMSMRFNQKIVRFGIARVFRVTVMVAVLFWLIGLRAGGLAAIVVSEAVASAAELVLCCVFDGFLPRPAPLAGLGPLLRLGLPLTLAGLGVFLNDLSDRYVVFLLLGGEANGFYAAAAKIALAGSFCAEAFNSMWFPYYFRFAQNKEFHEKELKEFSRKLVLLFGGLIGFLCIALPLLASVTIFGRSFVSPAYRGIAVVIAPLTLVYFFKMATYVSTPVLTFRGKILKLSAITWAAAGLNVVVNIAWCRLFGREHLYEALTAIALTSSVSYGICMIWTARAAGLLVMRDWLLSRMTLACGALLVPAFLPVPVFARFCLWLAVAALLYKKQFANSNVVARLLSGR